MTSALTWPWWAHLAARNMLRPYGEHNMTTAKRIDYAPPASLQADSVCLDCGASPVDAGVAWLRIIILVHVELLVCPKCLAKYHRDICGPVVSSTPTLPEVK